MSEPTTLDLCKETLARISKAKMPAIRGLPSNEKIDKLESYLIDTAIFRQEAHEAKLLVQEALDDLQAQWDAIEGWEIELPTTSKRTQADVVEAKRQVKPDLYSSIQTGKRLVDRLSEQIKRLEKDDNVSSRAYTLITGG